MNDVYRILLLKFVLSLGMQYSKYKYFFFIKQVLAGVQSFHNDCIIHNGIRENILQYFNSLPSLNMPA